MNDALPRARADRDAPASRRASAAALALASALGACAPALDWRAVTLPDTELEGQLPCRPGRFERSVVVDGQPLRLFMLSCEAEGVTYGLATAEVGDSARVEAVLAGLLASAREGIRASGTPEAWQIAGATPYQGNVSARLRGVRPDGVVVEESLRLFGRGTRVYEAAAIGRRLDEAALAPFHDGLHVRLRP